MTTGKSPKRGMNYLDLDTPALLLDLDAFESNIDTMAEFMRAGSATLRPHAKTHKCPTIAHKQIEAGAIGICCQKLGEAEVMCAHGINDVLITNQIVGPQKIQRLVHLASTANVKPAVDNPSNVPALAEAATSKGLTLGVVIEVDVGMGRCGVAPGEKTVQLAKTIDRTPNVELRGLMGYEGHCVNIRDYDERLTKTRSANDLLLQSAIAVEDAGIPVGIVSGGGTGTYMITGRRQGITEVEAGSYVLMDTTYRAVTTDFDVSLTALATVISTPTENRVILDCGSKTLAGDHGTPAILGYADARSARLSEEHCIVVFDEPVRDLRVGAKVRVIVGHCCGTVNLNDQYYVIQGDEVVDVWPIAAARKTQ